MYPADFSHNMIEEDTSDVVIVQQPVLTNNAATPEVETIVPTYIPAAEVVYAEPAIAIEDDSMVYPVEPYPIAKPLPIPPPIPSYFPVEELYPIYPSYGGSELDSYFYQFCESSSEVYSCSRHEDIVQRLSPKIVQLAELIKSSFDEERQEEIRWMIRDIVENKFYEVATEKSKFTISFIWIALQENLFEEDVEDVDSWLGDAITNLSSIWQITSISEAPWDMTRISWDRITSSNNTFWLEINASFDSGRAVTPDQWYEVLAHFGDVGAYFIDRENIRHGNYDRNSKSWKFDSDGEYGFSPHGGVPDVDNVSIYLLCYYCEWEEFHADRWWSRVADVQTFAFEKLDDNMSYDIELEVWDYSNSTAWDDAIVTINYMLHNRGVEEIAWVRTNIWAYPMTDSRWYGDEMVDRTLQSANCAGNMIDENDFMNGNIVLWVGQSCSVTETVTIASVGDSGQIDLSVDVEARMDQNRNNNNRNTVIEL